MDGVTGPSSGKGADSTTLPVRHAVVASISRVGVDDSGAFEAVFFPSEIPLFDLDGASFLGVAFFLGAVFFFGVAFFFGVTFLFDTGFFFGVAVKFGLPTFFGVASFLSGPFFLGGALFSGNAFSSPFELPDSGTLMAPLGADMS